MLGLQIPIELISARSRCSPDIDAADITDGFHLGEPCIAIGNDVGVGGSDFDALEIEKNVHASGKTGISRIRSSIGAKRLAELRGWYPGNFKGVLDSRERQASVEDDLCLVRGQIDKRRLGGFIVTHIADTKLVA